MGDDKRVVISIPLETLLSAIQHGRDEQRIVGKVGRQVAEDFLLLEPLGVPAHEGQVLTVLMLEAPTIPKDGETPWVAPLGEADAPSIAIVSRLLSCGQEGASLPCVKGNCTLP